MFEQNNDNGLDAYQRRWYTIACARAASSARTRSRAAITAGSSGS